MNSSTSETQAALAAKVEFTGDALNVVLSDGRTVSVPLAWYPRLLHGTPSEQANWRLVGSGGGIHWPDLDEDISVRNILDGRTSGESRSSLKRWLDNRSPRGIGPSS